MKKFEYCIFRENESVKIDELNSLGLQGWELCSVVSFNQPHMLLIRKSIEENELIGETGQSFANIHSFKFSDGEILEFTQRAWGDLMQAIVGQREGYMRYYL
jgi:hypothetical protein